MQQTDDLFSSSFPPSFLLSLILTLSLPLPRSETVPQQRSPSPLPSLPPSVKQQLHCLLRVPGAALPASLGACCTACRGCRWPPVQVQVGRCTALPGLQWHTDSGYPGQTEYQRRADISTEYQRVWQRRADISTGYQRRADISHVRDISDAQAVCYGVHPQRGYVSLSLSLYLSLYLSLSLSPSLSLSISPSLSLPLSLSLSGRTACYGAHPQRGYGRFTRQGRQVGSVSDSPGWSNVCSDAATRRQT